MHARLATKEENQIIFSELQQTYNKVAQSVSKLKDFIDYRVILMLIPCKIIQKF